MFKFLRNVFPLCLMFLTLFTFGILPYVTVPLSMAQDTVPLPKEHQEYLNDETYKQFYTSFLATYEEAQQKLPADDFSLLQEQLSKLLISSVQEDVGYGNSKQDAWGTAFVVGQKTLNDALSRNWLQHNAKGMQGLYLMQRGNTQGTMEIYAGDTSEIYAVKITLISCDNPKHNETVDGFGMVRGDSLEVINKNKPDEPLKVLFKEGSAVVSASETFEGTWTLQSK